MKALILYHANCMDGFTAAWIAEGNLSQVMDTYSRPVQYNTEPPWDDIDEQTQVYILDFSYKPEVLRDIASNSAGVVLLDHHKSALQELAGFKHPKVTLLLDPARSGAGLSWAFFNADATTMPELVLYVQDRDLWNFHYKNTRPFCALLDILPMQDFSELDAISDRDVESVVAEGEIILKYKQAVIKRWVSAPSYCNIAGYLVPCLNAHLGWASELGEAMYTGRNVPFVAVFAEYQNESGAWERLYSLRSDRNYEHAVDVSVIAQLYGGGGHRNAAGFRIPVTQVSNGDPSHLPVKAGIVWDNPLQELGFHLDKAAKALAKCHEPEED